MNKLKDKVVVITGGNSGIGRSTALLFAKEGAKVVISARRKEKLEEVAREITNAGGTCLAIPTDVTNEEKVINLINKTVERFGRLDMLVNNAGIRGKGGELRESPTEDWDKVIDTNLKSVYLCSKAAIKIMEKQKEGLIINVSSMAGKEGQGYPTSHIYHTSKWGIMGFSECLRKSGKPFNIRITTICPGTADTPFRPTPSPNALKPEDVADCILLVASLPDRVNILEIDLMSLTEVK